jgi:Phytanoyl-CoA dioxygenase (PhyH)
VVLIKEVTDNLFAINAKDISANGVTMDEVNQLRDCFARSGCLVIEDVFEPDYIDNLKYHFDQRYGCLPETELEGIYYKVGDKRYQFTMEMTAPFSESPIYAHPIMLAVNEMLLGEKFLLDSYVSVLSLAGASDQNIHRDCPPLFENEALHATLPPYALTVIIPLVDIDLQCGSTSLWPGSQKHFSRQSVSFENPTLPLVKRGSIYLWDYRLFHAGAANNSSVDRPILSLVYCKRWFSDTTNFFKEPPIYLARNEYEKIPNNVKFLFDRFLWNLT